MLGSWIDGGKVHVGQVGETISVVLWPVAVGSAELHTEWVSVRKQKFLSSEGIDLKEASHVTLYQWRVEGIDENDVVILISVSESGFGRHVSRPGGWQQLVSLCAGMGGSSLGAEAAGFVTQVCCDRSQLACEALERNSKSVVIQGDFGSIGVVQAIHQAKGETRMLLECGFPCQPFSRLGDGRMFGDSRSHTFVKALQSAWLMQSLGVILECVDMVYENEEIGRLLDELCQLMHLQRHERVLHLHDCWPSRRSRWWCILCPTSWCFNDLASMPSTPWTQIRHIIPDWPQWSSDEENQLRWTDEEVAKYGDPAYGNPQRVLTLSGVAPTALHPVANHFSGCPCGCRANPLSDGRLRKGGLHGIEVISARAEHFARHPHPQELGLLNGITPAFNYGPCMRGALCLIGQVASPLQSMWVFLHLRKGIEQNVTAFQDQGNIAGAESTLFQLYCDDLLEARKAFWPISEDADVGSCQIWTGECAPFVLSFRAGTCVREVLEAHGRWADHPGLWLVEKGGRVLPGHALICDGDFLNVRRTHSLLVEPSGEEIKVTFTFQGESRTFEVPRGSFLFECFKATPDVITMYHAYSSMTHEPCFWDTRLWSECSFDLELPQRGGGSSQQNTLRQILQDGELQSWQKELHARGDAPSLDEGLDDLIVYFAGKALAEITADPNVKFIGPRKAHAWKKCSEAEVESTIRSDLDGYDGDRVIVLFGADGHWALIDYQLLSGGSECAYVDGIPDRLADEASWFGQRVHDAFGAGPLSFTAASCFCQEGGVSCGAVALLHLGWRLGLWSSFNKGVSSYGIEV